MTAVDPSLIADVGRDGSLSAAVARGVRAAKLIRWIASLGQRLVTSIPNPMSPHCTWQQFTLHGEELRSQNCPNASVAVEKDKAARLDTGGKGTP